MPLPSDTRAARPLRILLVHWHDIRHPSAGGAEHYTHEIYRRLVAGGDQVTQLSAGGRGLPDDESIDGIRVVRAGDRHRFLVRGPAALRRRLREEPFDVVVESHSKLPIATPLLTRRPCVLHVHHLFGRTAFAAASLPVALASLAGEAVLARLYRSLPVVAVSASTRGELATLGFDGPFTIVPPSAAASSLQPGVKADEPTLAIVGRLAPYKTPETVLEAVARLRAGGRRLSVDVVGDGPGRPRLEACIARLGLSDQVTVHGYVDEECRDRIMQRAWVLGYSSPKEGWGMTVSEAAVLGTPAIASDVAGLRDAVQDGRTGLLVPHDDPEAWARALDRVVEDEALRATLATAARLSAASWTWDDAAKKTRTALVHAARAGSVERAP